MEHTVYHHPDPAVAATLNDMVSAAPLRVDEGTSGTVSRTRMPLVLNDVDISGLLERFQGALRTLDLRAAMTAPMFADDRYLGLISLSRYGDSSPYTDADVEMAVDIAARVALA